MGTVMLVTGGSSGIGFEAARAACARGATVYALSRRGTGPDGAVNLACDVTDERAVEAAVQAILEKEGRIDTVIANAGMGISGAVEFTDAADAARLFDVNFFGAARVIRAVLPAMRAAGQGRILAVGSVAGEIAIPFQAYYSASKAALTAYAMALRGEVAPYGIGVAAILPGDIATGFTDAREKSPAGDDAYGGRIARSIGRMERDEQRGIPAEKAGRRIADIALKRRVKPLYAVGAQYALLMGLTRLLPSAAVSWLVRMLYAR